LKDSIWQTKTSQYRLSMMQSWSRPKPKQVTFD